MDVVAEEKKSDFSVIYVVMEVGDDYHGTRPVCACSDKTRAEEFAKESEADQMPDCGVDTCGHRYAYVVHKIYLIG